MTDERSPSTASDDPLTNHIEAMKRGEAAGRRYVEIVRSRGAKPQTLYGEYRYPEPIQPLGDAWIVTSNELGEFDDPDRPGIAVLANGKAYYYTANTHKPYGIIVPTGSLDVLLTEEDWQVFIDRLDGAQ